MSRSKTVVRQTLIGEAGIALIHKRVTEMGYLFHPRRVDHGIDGHIDLVDPGSGAVLNLVLLVQSKASGLPYSYETETSFQYTCSEADLNYWLSGNAPVLLVLSHPDSEQAWWVDVRAEFSDARRRAERSVVVDKQRQVFDASAASHLLRMAMPRDSGLFLTSPPKKETLTSNLLPIVTMPPVIYVAPSAATTYPAAGELLAGRQGAVGGWMLRDGMVISFTDLAEEPLNSLRAGDVELHETTEWASSDELDTQYRFMDLLARALAADHRGDLRWHNDRKHLHFRATADLGPRREGKADGRRGHTVFGPHSSKTDPDAIGFYRHAALMTRFRRFDGRWHCQLSPDYCFTSDGWTEHRHADALLAGIKRLDRHAAVAGWTRTWATYLTRPADLFAAERALGFGALATFEVDRGIDDRLWGPAPAQTAAEDPEGSATTAAVDAGLAAAGVDAADLLALDDDGPDDDAPPPKVDTRPKTRRRTGPRGARTGKRA
ncbi:DUF4365 domain-containing protein [Pseudofrankia sp. BMG5.37]|uniref:DUF4365 domain-containing protein n=1 Tax=Pseudofrankia sp. BMG5.37 TaxID=3050035 RepID=UPI002895215C|nr:DUF4365 domain-containing protein [Pseudofrankia sp. BMG5.37]MDT3446035.1 DUF4365 domain-containing protein [Pseudofrankia sp. BMG5.37]